MNIYISLLRGINVSGKNLIKMEALLKMYNSLGFSNVKTYLQSGNVIFSTTKSDSRRLTKEISDQIKIDFNLDVPVLVLTIDTLQRIIDNNPFLKDPNKEPEFLHVTFLSSPPGEYDTKTFEEKKSGGEEIVISTEAVYLYCPHGYGNTKLTNTFLEKKLKTGATTRNWKTTNKLLSIAKEP